MGGKWRSGLEAKFPEVASFSSEDGKEGPRPHEETKAHEGKVKITRGEVRNVSTKTVFGREGLWEL